MNIIMGHTGMDPDCIAYATPARYFYTDHQPVKACMSRKLITGSTDTTIRELHRLMLSNNIGHMPVVADSKIEGTVTRPDYLEFINGGKP